MITFLNPTDIHVAAGAYTHTAAVPPGMGLIFVSGQVGIRPDGSTPSSLAEQADVIFSNIRSCLAAHGVGVEAIAKVTSYLTPGQDFYVVQEIRKKHFGDHRPAATAVYVPQLVDPSFLLEVEVVAVKPAS